MHFQVRYLLLLLVAATALMADLHRVIMPTEIGVSCRKHKPFTAIARTTLTRVYASGTKRTVTTEDRIARDREGRVLREQHAPWTEDSTQPVYYINIVDPQKMERIHIDPQKDLVVARPVDQRTQWDYVPYDGTQYRIATKPGVTVHTELLGNQQINGLKCWGQRTTYVYSPGTFQGNQQPLTRTWEVWYAKDLGGDVRILAHDPDPEAGDQQTELIDITYSEPDPSIFTLPTGYAVQSAQP
ncbi:MAG: hypothetical protein WBQ89_06065 [Candidatus Acidiferrum sp.]